jgi:hypothetical protein
MCLRIGKDAGSGEVPSCKNQQLYGGTNPDQWDDAMRGPHNYGVTFAFQSRPFPNPYVSPGGLVWSVMFWWNGASQQL